MTDYSMILMLKSGTIANTSSYQDLMAAAFGRMGFAILSVLQFMFPFVREYVYWLYTVKHLFTGHILPAVY